MPDKYAFKTFFAALLSLVQFTIYAQSSGTPTYYTANGTTYDNAAPLNGGNNRCQWLYGPNLFSTNGVNGTSAKAGKIDAIYFKAGTFLTTTANFADFTIKLSQNAGTATTWSSAAWNTGMTTVFYKSSLSLSNSFAASWVKIPLQTYFTYDPSKSLVFELSVSSGTGCGVKVVVGSNNDRIYGTYTGSTPTGYNSALINFGFDIVPIPDYNAGTEALVAPVNFCAGSYDVKVKIANNGKKKLDSVRVNWSVDGTLQKAIYYTKAIDTLGSSKGNYATITLDSLAFASGAKKQIKVWTSHPNGGADSANADDTLLFTLSPALSGNFTIGGTGADYSTISAAVDDLNKFGVCGPVQFKIASGTYKERLVLNKIGGASPTNTILFLGASRSGSIIEYDASSTEDWQTILLNGTSHVTFRNLTIQGDDKKYAVGIHLVGASNNTVDSCDVILPTGTTEIFQYGILGSGSVNDQTPGNSGDNNTFSNLSIKGGYYGIYYSGSSAFILNSGITFRNNTLKDFYREGMHLLGLRNTTIDSNVIASQRWVNNTGVYLSALAGFTFTRNTISAVYQGLYMDFSNYYSYSKDPSFVANNMIISTGSFETTLYYKYSRKVKFYHNSLLAYTANCVKLENSDSTTLRNNIFASLSKASLFSSAKTTFTTQDTVDNNIYYAPNSTSTVLVFWEPNAYGSISSWFSSVAGANKNSLIRDPGYVSGSDLHLKNGNRPTGGMVGISRDIEGKIRCIYSPTIGAQEMSKDIQADTSKPVHICEGDTMKLRLVPPKGFTNATYGSKWTIDSVSFLTPKGSGTSNYKVTYPSSTDTGILAFFPGSKERDSFYFVHIHTSITSAAGCDSAYENYLKVEQKPVADFTVSKASVCLGESITFTNKSVTSGITKYAWDMGNGDGFRIEGITYTFDKPGKYTVTLAVTSGNGCTDIKTKPMEVFDLPRVKFSSAVQCAGKPVTFTDSTTAQQIISKRVWTFGDGGSDTSANPKHIFANAGTYKVRLEVTTSAGCSDSTVQTIIIPEKTSAGFDFKEACLGKSVQFSNLSQAPSSATVTYAWDFDDGTTSTTENPDHIFPAAKTYSVRLITYSSNGCGDTITKDVAIYPNPKITVSAPTGNICQGEEVSFVESTTPAGKDYYWNFGDGSTSSDQTGKHTYSQTGTFTVWVTITTAQECTDSASTKITIDKTPLASFSADTVCQGEMTRFTNTSQDDSAAAYSWDFGDGETSTDKEPIHSYTGAKIYTVKMKVLNPITGCTDIKTQDVIVNALPDAKFSIQNITDRQKKFTPADSMQLSYLWHFDDGDSSTKISPSHTYGPGAKNYVVQLKVTNKDGCVKEYTDTAKVHSVGIEETEGQNGFDLSIYPNPFSASAYLQLRLAQKNKIRIELLDFLGRHVGTIADADEVAGVHEYEISSTKYKLQPGAYFVRISIGDTQVAKMIILIK